MKRPKNGRCHSRTPAAKRTDLGSKDLVDPLGEPVRAFSRDAKRERLQVEPIAQPVLLKTATAFNPFERSPKERPGEEAGEDEVHEVGPSGNSEDVVGEQQLPELLAVGDSELGASEAGSEARPPVARRAHAERLHAVQPDGALEDLARLVTPVARRPCGHCSARRSASRRSIVHAPGQPAARRRMACAFGRAAACHC